MGSTTTDRIRNVVLVGHGGCGKTSLAEALLHQAGATNRAGDVEQTTELAVLPFEWKGHRINLIDTPGEADLVGEVHAALRVADLAVFVVSAVEGVEVQTEAIWRLAASQGLPRLVFVNKLDRERADFERTLESLRERFGAGVAPLELPIGQEADFRGVADLLSDTAWFYDGGSSTHGEVPDDMEALEHRVHDNLVEGIVVGDDAQLERYLEGDVPSVEELEHTLAVGVDDATVFPVVCGSATAEVALDRLADFLCEIGPSPLDRPPVEVQAGDTQHAIGPDAAGQPLLFVYKTLSDQFVGHLTLFRVLSGTVRSDDHLVNPRSATDERLHGLFRLRGREQEAVDELVAGDLGAVAKLSDTRTGDTLAPKGLPVRVAPLDLPEPRLAIGVRAASQADDDKLGTALHRLLDEDPVLRVERDDETHQTLLWGLGDIHLNLALTALTDRYGVHLETEPVRIRYRETISRPTTAEGRHKKQSGGHGEFAVCTIEVEPLPRGAGFEFADRIVGGAIGRNYIPAVQKGIEETMAEAGVFGYPVVDLRVQLVDGKEHRVDSSEQAFRTAGRLALQAALADGQPVLLEPVSRVEVTVPVDLQGDVLGDLNARRGRVVGSDMSADGDQVITALVPEAELVRYPVELRALTGGRATFTAEHDHYDPVPQHLVEEIRA